MATHHDDPLNGSTFAKAVTSALFARFPDLRPYAREDAPDGTITIEFPRPVKEGSLSVFTDNDEVTVEFAHFHSHCDNIDGAIELLRQVLEEELVVVVHTRNGRWAGSVAVRPEEVAAELSENCEVTSWRGTFDQKRCS